jgi:hypothetical protein
MDAETLLAHGKAFASLRFGRFVARTHKVITQAAERLVGSERNH